MSIESVMPSNHLILCCLLLLLPSIFATIRVFSSESPLRIRLLKYWSFSFSISPSKEYSGLISFMIGWFDLLAVQGTLKSLLQHHSLKASILQCPVFFMVQLSHPYMTNGKTIALTRWTFVDKVMSLLFNMLSRLVLAFLPRSKYLLISWLPSLSTVISEPRKSKVCHCSHYFPLLSICHEVMWQDAMILVFWMLSFKPAFSLSSFTFIKRLLVPLFFVPQVWCHLQIWGYWYSSWHSWFQLVIHPARPFTWCALNDSEIPEIYSLDWKLCNIGNILQEKPHCELSCKGKPCLDWLAVELVPERWIRIT